MHPISIITLVAVSALYGIVWHNQSARADGSERTEEGRLRYLHSRPVRVRKKTPRVESSESPTASIENQEYEHSLS